MWHYYINVFLGFCVLIVAFLGVPEQMFRWVMGFIGAFIIVMGLWGGAASSEDMTRNG